MSLTVLAWLDDYEWYVVYRCLFYGTCDQKRAALNQIKLWRCRVGADIPVAIEATSRLMECKMELPLILNDNVKQQILGSSVSQFIGLITENGLKGTGPATRKPIHVLGEEIGIPQWIVHLRNGTVHGLLPSTNMLERAFEFAIEWVQENYWNEKAKHLKYLDDAESSMPDEQMIDVLRQYAICAKQETYSGKYNAKPSNIRMAVLKKLKSIMEGDQSTKKNLYQILFSNNLLTYEANADVVQVVVRNSCLPKFPENFTKCWRLIIYYIHGNELLFDFLMRVLSEIEYNSSASCQNRVDWYTACFDMIFTTMNKELTKFPIKLWNNLFKKVFLGKFMKYRDLMLKEMLNCLKYSCSMQQYKAMLKLTNIQQEVDGNHTFLLQSNPVSRATSIADQTGDGDQWQLCEGSNLEDCPIGLLPGQDIRSLQKSLLASKLLCKPVNLEKVSDEQTDYTENCGEEVHKSPSVFNNSKEQWSRMAEFIFIC